MANQQDIEETYDYMDELFRLTIGENGDITCALYNGDFSKSLTQAQKDKHDYILDAIHFKANSRVLDIGCGWGPMLKAVKAVRGGHAIGLTLSRKQAEACQRGGLEAYLQDWKDITVETFGMFDGIISVGAFEHFCSKEEYIAGKQDSIYELFFRLCHKLLPVGGRLYLQTMMWGKNAPECSQISLQAEKGSNEYLVAIIEKFYPGSWLPTEEQILRVAQPYFELISDNNGRLDYIETMEQWDRIWNWANTGKFLSSKLSFLKLLAVCKLLPRFLTDKDFRYKMEMFRASYHKECFRREIMDHQRLVFQRR